MNQTEHHAVGRGRLDRLSVALTNLIRRMIPTRIKAAIGKRMTSGIAQRKPVVQSRDGRKFKTIEDGLFFRVFYEGIYEPDLTTSFERLLRDDDTILDVGASFGWYTTLFAKYAPNGAVAAYEPVPDTYDVLCENLRMNGMEAIVDAKQICIGESDDTISFVRTGNSGLGHVATNDAVDAVEVPVVKLDHVAHAKIGKTALLKVHVEGFELNVLRGAEHMLASDPMPLVQVKLTDDRLERYGASRDEIFKFLVERGYDLYQVEAGGEVSPSKSPTRHEIFGVGSGIFADRFHEVFGC